MDTSLKRCENCGRQFAPRLADCPRCGGVRRSAEAPLMYAEQEQLKDRRERGPRDNRKQSYERISLYRGNERLRALAAAFDKDDRVDFWVLQHASIQAEASLDSDARLENIEGSLRRIELLLEQLVAIAEATRVDPAA